MRGGAVGLATQALKFALDLTSVVVLARLLTPADYGVVGMVAAVVGVLYFVKDLGLATVTIQRHEIDHDQITALFWVNVLASVALFVLNVPLAFGLAWFYDDRRLTAVAIVMAVGFLCGGLSTQHEALLRRRMRFGALARAEITALAASLVAASLLAVLAVGYWALVAQIVVSNVATALCLWMSSAWRPGPPARAHGVVPMLAFGGAVTVTNVLAFAIRNVDNVLVGWRWGATELGLYKRAYSVLLLPIERLGGPIAAVVLPSLSRLQHDPRAFVELYRKTLLVSAGIGMPVVAVLFVAAEDVIHVLLGPQWLGAVAMFQALAPAAWVGTTNVALGATLLALGEGRRLMSWSLIAAAVQITGFVVGLPWGAVGVAVAFSGVTLALRPIALWLCYRSTPMTPGLFYRAVSLPALASIVAVVAGFLVRRELADVLQSPVATASAASAVVLTVYAIPWLVIRTSRTDAAELLVTACSAFRNTDGA